MRLTHQNVHTLLRGHHIAAQPVALRRLLALQSFKTALHGGGPAAEKVELILDLLQFGCKLGLFRGFRIGLRIRRLRLRLRSV